MILKVLGTRQRDEDDGRKESANEWDMEREKRKVVMEKRGWMRLREGGKKYRTGQKKREAWPST